MRSLRQTRKLIRPLAVMSCALLVCAGTALAEANHDGWPPIGHHEGHPNNESGTMRGQEGVHNMLLGGDGNDTIWAGNDGDVIWGDSHPGGQPTTQQRLPARRRPAKTGSTRATATTRSGPARATTTSRSSTATASSYCDGPGPEDAGDALPAAEPAVEARRLRSQGDRPLPGVAPTTALVKRRGRGHGAAAVRRSP